jgi:lysophospholipase L1-like esterase
MGVQVDLSQAAMADRKRARQLFWNVALVFFAIVLVIFLVDLTFGLVALRGHGTGTLDSAAAYEKVYYRATWAVLMSAATGLIWFRISPPVIIGLACAICVELGAYAVYGAVTGRRFNPVPAVFSERFIPHPLLQGIPRPGKFGQYTHTETNLRVTVNDAKTADAVTIAAYGGSTTYDLGVDDENTWSSHLSRLLGSRVVVENHGVPGYSTVEHIIQASFEFRSTRPRCAIFYVGWNDLRNNNIKDLRADYSDFHLLTQTTNLAIYPTTAWVKRRSAFLSLIGNFGIRQILPIGEASHEYDARLTRIYRDNVTLIANISNHFGVTPIFVPQVLNYEKFTSKVASRGSWMPFVIGVDVRKLMAQMNGDLASASHESGSQYLDDVLQIEWVNADFVDSGHFSASGSRKFAGAIAKKVTAACS